MRPCREPRCLASSGEQVQSSFRRFLQYKVHCDTIEPPQALHLSGGRIEHRFVPCRDTNILIQNDNLFVNDRPYGQLTRGSSILVDHGVVSVSGSTIH